MLYALIVITAIDLVLLLNLCASLVALRPLERFTPAQRASGDWPRISVLVPARNEAANIERCLRTLLVQAYPNAEFLVLDDESTDETAAIVATLAARDPRLRLLHGGSLPTGWLGKCNACAQLAEAATGDYLLFTDADTVHGLTSLASALAAAEQRFLGLVSVLPRQTARTGAERLMLPLLPLNILALLPVGLVRRRPEPSLSAGIGQFLFFRRDAYRAAGGHTAVHDQVLDDVMLARRVKAAGWRMDLLDGGTAVRCRMYDSFGAIWRGFSKNLFDFYGRSPFFTLLAVALHFALFVAPPVLALGALALHASPLFVALPAIAYFAVVTMRLLEAVRVGAEGTDLRGVAGWWSALAHPVAEGIHCAITLNSLRWGLRGQLDWKGRTYTPSVTP